jgi:hypothetical protein
MSYIYSQALVAAFSEASCSDIAASAPSSENPTPKPCWWHDRTMEPSPHSRFGMTYAALTEDLGAELLTWFAEDSLARTSASPETAPDWTASGQGYGPKWLGSLGKYDHATHTLKTAQLSLLGASTECSPTLPRWGLMLDGELYPQPMLAPRTAESESGSWATPTASMGKKARGNPLKNAMDTIARGFSLSLPEQVAWRIEKEKSTRPTPKANDAEKRGNFDITNPRNGLPAAVRQWPTATATAYKGWSPNHNRASTDDRLDYSVERESFQPGQQTPPMRLNPDWVEWLMGWPIGHTALKPLETGRLAEWWQQHGIC